MAQYFETSAPYTVAATAGQTEFTITGGYDEAFVEVYLNGVLLPASAYTLDASTNKVTLGTAARLNDELHILRPRRQNPAEVAVFDLAHYVPESLWTDIAQSRVDSQDETAMCGYVQDWTQAALEFLATEGDGTSLLLRAWPGAGRIAMDDEIFNETAAQAIYDLRHRDSRIALDADGPFVFQAQNWAAQFRARASGFYAEQSITDVVPVAMFRWEQFGKYITAPMISRKIVFRGELNPDTDPIAVKIREAQCKGLYFTCQNFANTEFFLESHNNGQGEIDLHRGGFQPLLTANGLMSDTVRFTTTADSAVVTSNEDTFVAGHAGQTLTVEGAGTNGRTYTGTIATVDGARQVTMTGPVPRSVADGFGSHSPLRGSIDADSNLLTLAIDTGRNYIGEYVYVVGAGSKKFTDHDVLVTRVTGQADEVLSLATAARITVSDALVGVRPAEYRGFSDDMLNASGDRESGHMNDERLAVRNETGVDGYRSINAIYQRQLGIMMNGSKWHAPSAGANGIAGNARLLILDYCKEFSANDSLLDLGGVDPNAGAVEICGTESGVDFRGLARAASIEFDSSAIFYVNPNNSDVANTRLSFSGRLNSSTAYGGANRWPAGGQITVRFGANGSEAMVRRAGPFQVRFVATAQYEPTERLNDLESLGTITALGGLQVPTGAAAARPTSPGAGALFFNTDTNLLEVYNGSTWVAVHS